MAVNHSVTCNRIVHRAGKVPSRRSRTGVLRNWTVQSYDTRFRAALVLVTVIYHSHSLSVGSFDLPLPINWLENAADFLLIRVPAIGISSVTGI